MGRRRRHQQRGRQCDRCSRCPWCCPAGSMPVYGMERGPLGRAHGDDAHSRRHPCYTFHRSRLGLLRRGSEARDRTITSAACTHLACARHTGSESVGALRQALRLGCPKSSITENTRATRSRCSSAGPRQSDKGVKGSGGRALAAPTAGACLRRSAAVLAPVGHSVDNMLACPRHVQRAAP